MAQYGQNTNYLVGSNDLNSLFVSSGLISDSVYIEYGSKGNWVNINTVTFQAPGKYMAFLTVTPNNGNANTRSYNVAFSNYSSPQTVPTGASYYFDPNSIWITALEGTIYNTTVSGCNVITVTLDSPSWNLAFKLNDGGDGSGFFYSLNTIGPL